MPPSATRCALTGRKRGLTLAIALGLALCAPLGPARADDPPRAVSLSLGQARVVARQALDKGDAKTAVLMARGLLQADPNDTFALFVLAKALEVQGQHGAGRRAAARAFRASTAPKDRFMAAQMAAGMAYADGRYGLSQYWLRRSMDPAPTQALKDQAVSDFRRVRHANPWNTNLRFTLQPSDNVNSGSDNPYFIVDGLPWYGIHSPDAMALSGTVLRLEANSSYRLRQSERSVTRLTGQVSTKRVRLSSEARAAAPDLSGKDLSSTLAEIGFDHRGAVGADADKRGAYGLSGAIGQVWFGGDVSYRYAKLAASRSFALSDRSSLRLRAEYELRDDADAANPRSDHVQIRGDYALRLPNESRLGLGLVLDHADSDRGNITATHTTAFVSYDFGQAVAPVDLRVTLGARDTDFPTYFVGFSAIPGGRQDDAVFASLDVTFSEIDYAGFVPRVSVIAQRTRSNISRFETSSTALSFGIESKF